MDMASRRVLGFALGEHHDAQLAYSALVMAVAVRGGQVPGVIMHTDQGSEYTAGLVRQACGRLAISQSMGRPGSALDNAVIESWHSTLEFELRSVEHFATRAAARARVSAWIEDYNTSRRHSALGMMSPVDYEQAPTGRGGSLRCAALLRRPGSAGARPCQGRSSLDRACALAEYGSYREARTGKISQIKVSTLSGEPRMTLINAIPPVRGRRGRPRQRPDAIYTDRGYDYDKYRRQVREKGIKPVIARCGAPHGSGLGSRRWVIEQPTPSCTGSAACASAGESATTSTKPS